MKRKIKFRITYQHEDTGRITQRIIELGHPIPHLGERWFVIGQDQFTGLKDKNGKEIYEGDVITSRLYPFNDGYIHDVYFKDGDFRLRWTMFRLSEMFEHTHVDIEVIGNIYENPELLKA